MRVVVTGAAGFIGTHLVNALVRDGHEVVGVDLPAVLRGDRAGPLVRGDLLDDRVTWLGVDLAADDVLPLLARDPHVLVHLAGRPGVRSSFGPGRAAAVRDNVTATRRVLRACLRGAGPGRGTPVPVLLASSSSVYGGLPRHRPQREADAARPTSPYARSKLDAERLALAAGAAGLPVLVLRYFSVYGSGQRPDMVFHRFAEAALDRRPLPVYGSTAQARSFTHVTDVVAATVSAATALRSGEIPGSTVLNVGHPVTATLAEAIDVLARRLGGRPAIDLRPAAPGDVPRTWADVTLAGRLLGWVPRMGLPEGLAEQLAWHLARRGPGEPRGLDLRAEPAAAGAGAGAGAGHG